MKRILYGVILLCMVFGLIGCGKETSTTTTTEGTQNDWSNIIPIPDSEEAVIEYEDSEQIEFMIEPATEEEFQDYVTQCFDRGFDYRYSNDYPNEYVCENEAGYYVYIYYYDQTKYPTELVEYDTDSTLIHVRAFDHDVAAEYGVDEWVTD